MWIFKILCSPITGINLRLSYNGYYTRLPSQGRGFDSHQPLKNQAPEPCPGSGAWFLTAVMRSRTGRRFVGASIARPRGLPGSLRFRKAVRRGQDPSLQITRRQGIIGKNANFRQVCRGRIYAPRGVCPLYRNIRAVATGGIYAAPTDLPVMFTLP